MRIEDKTAEALEELFETAVSGAVSRDVYKSVCEAMNVEKLYYDMDLGETGHYSDPRTRKIVISGTEDENHNIVLYDSGRKTGLKLEHVYYYEGREFVHAYVEFPEGINEAEIDHSQYKILSDAIYIIASRENMRNMLDFAEATDAMTGIPNVLHIGKRYGELLKAGMTDSYAVLYVNLQNFKYINETANSKCGDEAIIKYSRTLHAFMKDDECLCRMGGDNFAAYVRKERLQTVLEMLHSVMLTKLDNAPGRAFEISAWVGVSQGLPHDPRPFGARLNEASTACNIGKTKLKQSVVFFSEELKMLMNRGREIMSMFYPAIKNHEFHPYFQPKVNMGTGALVGFEALCRWIHDGRMIFPDQFIPVLDKEGLIHELDMAIFSETCRTIKQWIDMGLKPPRISTNFSRKNLFVQDIEQMIYNTIIEAGISTDNVEVEITESVQEAETERLIEFVRKLKSYGIHISIDDFGTGYSSLMLIHNIDADILKIDKSFVDALPGERKSEVLIESIIGIANNLDMSLIAEGVETAEQGRELMRLGCRIAQGYYYSKPVDGDAACDMIRQKPFKAIE